MKSKRKYNFIFLKCSNYFPIIPNFCHTYLVDLWANFSFDTIGVWRCGVLKLDGVLRPGFRVTREAGGARGKTVEDRDGVFGVDKLETPCGFAMLRSGLFCLFLLLKSDTGFGIGCAFVLPGSTGAGCGAAGLCDI